MPSRHPLLLRANCPHALADAAGSELRAVAGMVWITETGAAGDVFLRAGESHRIEGRGRVVIEALRGAARVELHRCAPRSWAGLIRDALRGGSAAATPARLGVVPAPTFRRR